MSSVFLHLFNISITAGWIVLAVLLLRLCFKKSSRWITCLLWGLVALRLMLPFHIESPFSVIPSAATVVQTETESSSSTIEVDSGFAPIDEKINNWLTSSMGTLPEDSTVSQPNQQPPLDSDADTGNSGDVVPPVISENESQTDPQPMVLSAEMVLDIASMVWLIGLSAMLVYECLSAWFVRRRVLDAVLLRENIWESDRINTPFIFGLFRPRIYVPYGLEEPALQLVVAHERAHMHRCDHWIKPLAFTLLAVYWYHPLLWVAYFLLCRDIEVACDERVVRTLSDDERRLYATALLKSGTEHRSLMRCPLAFAEVGIKQRIFTIISYRKPAVWVVILTLLVCLLAAVCLLTVPQSAAAQGMLGALPNEDVTATTSTTMPSTNGITTAPSSSSLATKTPTATTRTPMVKPTNSNHTHDFDGWSIITAPSCDSDGLRQRVCSCGYTESESIAAVGHTYIKNVCVTCGVANGTNFIPDYSYGQANTVGNEDGKNYVARQGDWLYYTTNYRYITKCRVDGTRVTKVFAIEKGSILNINVVGDWIYFFVNSSNINDCYIAKVRTDGSGFAYLVQAIDINEMLVVNDKLFFTMYANTYGKTYSPLYMMPLNGGITQQLHEGYAVHLTSDGEYLYFEQSPQSGNDTIYRLNLSTMKRSTVFSNYKGGNFVLKDDHIYYKQKDDEAGDYILKLFCLQDGSVTVLGRPQYMTDWFAVIGNCIYYCGMPDTDEWWNQDAGIVEYYPSGSKYDVIYVTGDDPDCIGLGDCLVWRDHSDETNYGRILRIYDCTTSQWIAVTG